jgi:hypothetical protein
VPADEVLAYTDARGEAEFLMSPDALPHPHPVIGA